jgi:hypothetical protein
MVRPGMEGPPAGMGLLVVKDEWLILNGARPSRIPRVRDILPPDARKPRIRVPVSPAGAVIRSCQTTGLRWQAEDAVRGIAGDKRGEAAYR